MPYTQGKLPVGSHYNQWSQPPLHSVSEITLETPHPTHPKKKTEKKKIFFQGPIDRQKKMFYSRWISDHI
jgi:hypothetical protein